MNQRNIAFFAYVENSFIVAKEMFGAEKAIKLMRLSLEKGLKSAYDQMNFKKGDPLEFVRCTKARDEAVGLRVEYQIKDGVITYKFLDDPFPNLKNIMTAEQVVSTYMPFKVSYLLGNEWSYEITKHLWKGDDRIEFIVEESKN